MNRVLVAVPGAEIAVPRESSDALLEELRRRDDAGEVIAAFEAVGATRPVELDVYSQVVVVETIRDMESRAPCRKAGRRTRSPRSMVFPC